jgi:cell division protein FtsI/penicillin-binding protein 2
VLTTIAAVLCVPYEAGAVSRSDESAASVGQRQKFLELILTRTSPCAGHLCAEDAQGRSWPLTLRPALQRSARRTLAASRPEAGALAAIEVKTGRIVALAEWHARPENEQSLLLRSFPAASLFKLVTSAALLEQAHIAPEQVVCTQGGQHRIEAENLVPPHAGMANCGTFFEALGYSRNAAFAQLAHRYLKPEDLENFADRFGFGSPLPLEARVEFGDFASNDEPLGFAQAASGFVGSSLSPLGAAYLAYVIANQGRAGQLQLLDGPAPSTGAPFAAIQPETAAVLHRMMELTVRRGTSWRAFHDVHGRPYLPGVSIAGKTGTLGDSEVTLSWFVGFAPSQHPEIAVSVLLRNGAVWHRKANEVARDWLRDYFTQRADVRRAREMSTFGAGALDGRAQLEPRPAEPTKGAATASDPERCSGKTCRSPSPRARHPRQHRPALADRR